MAPVKLDFKRTKKRELSMCRSSCHRQITRTATNLLQFKGFAKRANHLVQIARCFCGFVCSSWNPTQSRGSPLVVEPCAFHFSFVVLGNSARLPNCYALTDQLLLLVLPQQFTSNVVLVFRDHRRANLLDERKSSPRSFLGKCGCFFVG